MFKFHQWPFAKNEVIKLLWIKSPYKDKNNEWILPLLFLDKNNAVAEISTNWATLPFLRIGQFFVNGIPSELDPEGNITTLNIVDVSKGSLCDSSSMPDYSIKFKDYIRGERIWRFETQGNVVFIPCIELVRAFFASNSAIAKALLEYNGLEFLIPHFEASNEWVNLKLDYKVPRKIITEDLVQLLAWIKFDELANKIWHSILTNILPRGDIEPPLILFPGIMPKEDLGSAKKIQMIPPLKGPSTWEVRALPIEHNLLILDLMGVSNLVPPYQKIFYSHQTLIRREAVESTQSGLKRKVRKKKIEGGKTQKVIVSESPTGISNISILKMKPTMMRFSQKTLLEKEPKKVRVPSSKEPKNPRQISKRESREKEIIEHQEKLRKLREENPKSEQGEILYSSSVSSFLGNSDVSPIEIIGSKISNASYEDGLQQFKEMVDILGKVENRLKILPPKISSIPGNRSFAFKEDGSPRRYIIVEMQFEGRSYYLLEVERLSKIFLATLIIQARSGPSFGAEKLNLIVHGLLNGLIENHGNWKARSIENHDEAKIYRIKHLDEWSTYDWAEVILDRLNLPQ